jgi:hypothetical protein
MAIPLPSKVSKSEEFTLNRDSWQAAGLKGWWPLGGYNDARDLSGYGNHGLHASNATIGTRMAQQTGVPGPSAARQISVQGCGITLLEPLTEPL